jgi:hypothetical protein
MLAVIPHGHRWPPCPLLRAALQVGASEAALLGKLGIKPFRYGLEVLQVYDNGSLYDPAVLALTDDVLAEKAAQAIANVAAISLQIGYPTLASLPHRSAPRGDRGLPIVARRPRWPCLWRPSPVVAPVRARGARRGGGHVPPWGPGQEHRRACLLHCLQGAMPTSALCRAWPPGCSCMGRPASRPPSPRRAPRAHPATRSVVDGYKNVLAIAVETDYSFPLADKVKAYLADPSAFAVAAPTSAAPAAGAAAAKQEEPEEEEEEDMAFDLFG